MVCGSGNNGGDGIAIARLFHLKGVRAEFYMAGNKEKMTRETLLQYKIATGYQVPEVNNQMCIRDRPSPRKNRRV